MPVLFKQGKRDSKGRIGRFTKVIDLGGEEELETGEEVALEEEDLIFIFFVKFFLNFY